jgi:hypothetical protein
MLQEFWGMLRKVFPFHVLEECLNQRKNPVEPA